MSSNNDVRDIAIQIGSAGERNRDASEKLFRGYKSYLGEQSMRTYHDEPTHAKIFIEFIALIIRNKIYTCLKDQMKELKKKKKYMTVPEALKELDKIEIIRQMDGVYRLDHAVTATQKDILQAFNMTEATVKKEAGILGEQLRYLVSIWVMSVNCRGSSQ